MNKYSLGIGLLILLLAPLNYQAKQTSARSTPSGTHKEFFNNMSTMCGQRYEGVTDFPQNADHPMVGKKLVITFGPCTKDEIRIPFQVGEDQSRTWILSLGDKSLLFKHDHRHPDGTPDKVTMYGGWSAANDTPHLQRFPADADTVKLIPEAATNVWTLQIIPEKQQLVYYLERHGQPRYRAIFDLKTASRSAQNAKAPSFTSVYTNMKRDCRTLPEPKGADPGGDPAGVCKGYGGYRIFISHSAWSAGFSIQALKDKSVSIDLGNDYSSYGARGEKVEWRLANGTPFAVIIRLGKYKDRDDGENPYTAANRIGSTLIVKGLKGWEHVDFKLDGAAAAANVEARKLADQNYFKKK